MIGWEIRKSLNIILILAAAVLCAVWFWVCGSFFIGSYDGINGEIYRSYISQLSELYRDEQREYIENEALQINSVLSSREENDSRYLHGEISDEDYLKYIENYDICSTKKGTFEFIKSKFERIGQTDELRFIYDLELEGYLTTMTANFPLLILLLIVGSGVFISDIPMNAFVKTCKNGKGKTNASKLAAMLIIGTVLIIAFNFAELAALFSKDLGDLSAPAASMDKFASLDTNVSCFMLIMKTFLFRIVGEYTVCMIFFALSRLCENYFAYFCTASALMIIPAFFVNTLPATLRGIVPYYSLLGNTVLSDKNGLPVILCSAALIAVSVISVFLIKDRKR